ncbi:MAG: hypothetical protein JWQ21_2592 [Herminiimonas sp.]|nr:hypothetical protein [Herminiimonas sp.]
MKNPRNIVMRTGIRQSAERFTNRLRKSAHKCLMSRKGVDGGDIRTLRALPMTERLLSQDW